MHCFSKEGTSEEIRSCSCVQGLRLLVGGSLQTSGESRRHQKWVEFIFVTWVIITPTMSGLVFVFPWICSFFCISKKIASQIKILRSEKKLYFSDFFLMLRMCEVSSVTCSKGNCAKYMKFFFSKWEERTKGSFEISTYVVFGDDIANTYSKVIFEIVIYTHKPEIFFNVKVDVDMWQKQDFFLVFFWEL